jgi:PAS domain S-box-containing protein
MNCYEVYQARNEICHDCPTKKALETKKPAFSFQPATAVSPPVDIYTFPILNDEGEVTAVVEHGKDISERIKDKEALQESENRWRSLAENAPDIILTLDREGKILFINKTDIGITVDQAIGTNLLDYVPSENQDLVRQSIQKVFETGSNVHYETSVQGQNDRNLWYMTHIGPVKHKDKVVSAVMITSDITARKQAEMELLKEKEKLENITDSVNCGLLVLDDQARVAYANSVSQKWFGPLKQIVGELCWEIFKHKNPEKECAALKAMQTGKTVRSDIFMKSVDGEDKLFYVIATPVKDSNGKIHQITEVVVDITERKKMEKALLEIEEREQQRIGYELHDGLGQMLMGITLKSQNLESQLKEKSIPEAEDVSRITFLLEKTKEQLRLLMKGMLPVEMNVEGLSAALEELAWNTKEIFNVPCVFRCNMPVQLCNKIKNIHLFRIAQEAVANAVKHGRPERIEISLSRENDEFELTITDDGAGIPEISKETNGLGLKIMNYRAEMIGASLDIQSEIDRGTSITCIFYDTIDEK